MRKLQNFDFPWSALTISFLLQTPIISVQMPEVMTSNVVNAQLSWLQLPDLVMTRLVTEHLDSLAVKTMRLVSKEWRVLVDRNVQALKPRAIAGDGEVATALVLTSFLRSWGHAPALA